MKTSLIYMKMNQKGKLISWVVSHADSFWHRGKRQLGNGLFLRMMISNIYLSTQVIIAKIMHGSLNYIISWNHSYQLSCLGVVNIITWLICITVINIKTVCMFILFFPPLQTIVTFPCTYSNLYAVSQCNVLCSQPPKSLGYFQVIWWRNDKAWPPKF